jgi:hypothetical protein
MAASLTTIFLDPDGTHDIGYYVLVAASTGVRYETQCAGLLTDIRGAEGFIVSAGPASAATALSEWVMRRFRDYGHRPAGEWSGADQLELARLVEGIRVWRRGEDGEDHPSTLTLDPARLQDCLNRLA